MHEEGLIDIHISKIRAIAVGTHSDEAFESPIKQAVTEAISHINVVKTSDPKDNLQILAGRLTLLAETTDSSQTQIRAALEYASRLVHEQA